VNSENQTETLSMLPNSLPGIARSLLRIRGALQVFTLEQICNSRNGKIV
jgi:hypothetical protein